jgi:hypothetical protein
MQALQRLRNWPTSSQKFASATGLKDPESGAFYRKGRASLHFHEALRASSLICTPPTNGAFSRKRGDERTHLPGMIDALL